MERTATDLDSEAPSQLSFFVVQYLLMTLSHVFVRILALSLQSCHQTDVPKSRVHHTRRSDGR